MSLITFIKPTPTAPATSNLPFSFAWITTFGFPTYPFTFPFESAVTVIPFKGPPAFTCKVKRSFSPFIIIPIIEPAVKRRPSAAVATGLVLCAALANSTISLVVAANARIWLFAAVALTI